MSTALIVPLADARAYCGADEGDPTLTTLHRGVEKAVKQFLRWDPVRTTHDEYLPKGEPGARNDYFVGNFGVVARYGGVGDTLQVSHGYCLRTPATVYEEAGAYFAQVTGNTLTSSPLTYGTQWAWELDDESREVSRAGILLRLDTDWPKDRGSVEVKYTAGFSANEFLGSTGGEGDYTDASDIRLAVLNSLGKCYNEAKMHKYDQATGRPGGLVTGESIEGYSYSLDGQVAMAMAGNLRCLTPMSMGLLQHYIRYGSLLG